MTASSRGGQKETSNDRLVKAFEKNQPTIDTYMVRFVHRGNTSFTETETDRQRVLAKGGAKI